MQKIKENCQIPDNVNGATPAPHSLPPPKRNKKGAVNLPLFHNILPVIYNIRANMNFTGITAATINRRWENIFMANILRLRPT